MSSACLPRISIPGSGGRQPAGQDKQQAGCRPADRDVGFAVAMLDGDAGRCTCDQPLAGAGQPGVGGVEMQALAVSAQVLRLCTGRVGGARAGGDAGEPFVEPAVPRQPLGPDRRPVRPAERPDAQLPTRARPLPRAATCATASATTQRPPTGKGRTLSQADAIALASAVAEPEPGVASAVTVPAAGPATADGPAGLLSERERDIVALLAGGATDAQIGGRLFLSVNTVRSHLDSSYVGVWLEKGP